MNNQWGRSSGGAATAGGGGGFGGMLFASIICLALGGAGGYGASRFLDGGAPTEDLAGKDRRISDLAGELDARAGQVEENGRTIRTLTDENAALKRQLDTLRNNASASEAALSVAENARLTQEVVPALKNELELARQRTADAEALKKRAEESVRDGERQLARRDEEIARLRTEASSARDQQNAGRTAEQKRLEAEVVTLQRKLDDAEDAEGALRRDELAPLRDQLVRKDSETAALKAENGALAARVGALEAAARAVQPEGQGEAGGQPAVDNQKPDDRRTPRTAALVADAMRDTPGLDRLNGAQRDQLERALVSGECVTNALGAAFQRVPVLTLRNLMRDLDSDC